MSEFVGKKYNDCIKDGKSYLKRTVEWDTYLGKKGVAVLLKEANMCFLNDRDYSFKTYKGVDQEKNLPKLEKYIAEFEEKFKSVSLYFYGFPGTQKTITAGIIGKALLSKGYSVYYTNMVELYNLLIQRLFEKTEKLRVALDTAEKSDFLILDSFFFYDVSKKFISEMDSFLRRRIEEQKKPICFISRGTTEELGKKGMGNKNILSLVKRSSYSMLFKDVVNDFDIESLFI